MNKENIMKKTPMLIMSIVALGSLVACSKPAEAAVNTTISYENNDVVNVDGLNARASVEYANVRTGVTALATTDDARLINYGAFMQIPINVQNTKLTVSPTATVKQYRETDTTVGGLGMGFEYKLDKTVSFNSTVLFEKDLRGEPLKGQSYTFGVTKTF